jgi:hypothetical protein
VDYAKLEHQVLYLYVRGLGSEAMWECERRIRALEALSGDPSKLDPEIRARLLDELEEATLSQLAVTGRFDDWKRYWDEGVGSERCTATLVAPHA